MKELLSKISSYNLFNYLLPGVIYVGILQKITSINLLIENNLIGAFIYYFIGLIISRIGSLFIEPVLKKWKILKFSSYGDFIAASKEDEKIILFSEINNTYRTLLSLSIVLIMSILYDKLILPIKIDPIWSNSILCICLIILFTLSYRKQTEFINKRIEKYKSK